MRSYDKFIYSLKVCIRNLLFYFLKFIFTKNKFRYFTLYYIKLSDSPEIENTLEVFKQVDDFLISNHLNKTSQSIINNVDRIMIAHKEYKGSQNTWYANNTVEYRMAGGYSDNFWYVMASLAMFSLAIGEMRKNFKLPDDFHKNNLPEIFAYIDLFSDHNDELKGYFEGIALRRDLHRKL